MNGEWKTIKVRRETYEELKRMGEGISRAVDLLVKTQKEAFQRKVKDIEKTAGEIADILLRSGIFDIKFRGAGISGVEEDGTLIRIRGFVDIDIPNDEARAEIIRVLEGDYVEQEN